MFQLMQDGDIENISNERYICDTRADLKDIPKKFGTKVFCLEVENGGGWFMCNGAGQWIPIQISAVGNTTGSGSGSGSTTVALPVATKKSLGGVVVGENMNITPEGVLAVDEDVLFDEDVIASKDEVNDMLDEIFGSL